MKDRRRIFGLLALLVALAGCSGQPDEPAGVATTGSAQEAVVPTTGAAETNQVIDQWSYRLGGIGAFSEMVGAGVKKLALSSPLAPSEMDGMMDEAVRIAGEHDVEVYRESDFLVTDLFSGELTAGKEVLLIYRGETLQEYLDLKDRKRALIAQGDYSGEARREIARAFGALLSYSDEKIEALLAEGASG